MRRPLLATFLVLSTGLAIGAAFLWSTGRSNCANVPDYLRAVVCKPDVIGTGAFKKGAFKGSLEVRFHSTMSGDGLPVELVQLLQPFGYVDSKGVQWDVPAGFLSDGASIPDALWAVVGGPYSGPYRDAAVVHDYFCSTKHRPWQDVHDVFLEAALNRGTTDWKAQYMYAGILLKGPRWTVQKSGLLVSGIVRAQVTPTPAPAAKKSDLQQFEELKLWIEKEKPTREQIRKRVEDMRKAQGVPTPK